MSAPLGRRAWMIGTAAAAAACAKGARSPDASAADATATRGGTAPPDGGTAGITAETFAEAEKIAAVRYTPAQRAQLVDDAASFAKLVEPRRAVALPNALAPAWRFDPRLGAPAQSGGARGVRTFSARDPGPAPRDDVDLAFAPVTALAHWIRTRQVTSLRLTEVALDRLRRLGPSLECVVTPMEEQALRDARAADAEIARGAIRGPLHGVPWGAKDLLDTAGVRTTWGAAPFADRVPREDATVVRRLRDAGAVLVAKLSLGELANGDIWFGGKTRNPWNRAEGSSGSSAGSAAAVAAGIVPFALGSETMGSIVSPSIRCGVTGLRPTFGRVPRTGAMALCWSLDKLGSIARTVEDALIVLAAIHGPDGADPYAIDAPLAFDARAPVRGLRAGYDPSWFAHPDANDVERRALDAARDAGLTLVPIALPDLPYGSLDVILFSEAAAAFEELTLRGQEDALRVHAIDAWPHQLRRARFFSAVDLVQAQRLRRRAMEAMDRVMRDVDLVIGPGLIGPILGVTNMTRHPSLTLRAGFLEQPARGFDLEPAPRDDKGPKALVPHGITLNGRLFDEGTLCRAGMALEAALDVWSRRPSLG